jgi:hypothetical protein
MAGTCIPLPGISGKTFYRAEVRENGRITAKLKGKYNTQESLDDFLKDNFPWDPKHHKVEEDQDSVSLKVWKYYGPNFLRVTVDIRMPKPQHAPRI